MYGKPITINSLFSLRVIDEYEKKHYGSNQNWYREFCKRTSGCAPSTFANIFYYVISNKTNLIEKGELKTKNQCIDLMYDVWNTVTPSFFGISNITEFSNKCLQFGLDKQINLKSSVLEITMRPKTRPSIQKLSKFLIDGLQNDIPIAFLNRSNGSLTNLWSWHWVTVIGYLPKTMHAKILDNGEQFYIDLNLWLNTSILGGGFVALSFV